jgi:hypothetical protein
MLSSLAYSAFDKALSYDCLRRGVARVNPAYASIIGRAKLARRDGLSGRRGNGLLRETAPFLDGYRQGVDEQLGQCHPRLTREKGNLGASSEVEACKARVEQAEQGVSQALAALDSSRRGSRRT